MTPMMERKQRNKRKIRISKRKDWHNPSFQERWSMADFLEMQRFSIVKIS